MNEEAYHTDFGRRLQVILHLGRRGARLVRQGGDGGKRIGREEAKFLGLAPSLSQLFDRPRGHPRTRPRPGETPGLMEADFGASG